VLEIQGRTKFMTPEWWLIVTVAGAFLLVGIALSPLAWLALHHRRTRLEQRMEGQWLEIAAQVRAIEERLSRSDAMWQARNRNGESGTSPAMHSSRPGNSRSLGGARQEHPPASGADPLLEPALIAVPSLAGVPNEREASVAGLTERFAAIWTLADQGGSPETIARATGQPIGQIDLILGLRRQIVGSRTTIPHAPHV
jgi:hypothetical protein